MSDIGANLHAERKQTGAGALPRPWVVRPLGEVAEVRSGIAKNANVSIAQPISVHYLRVANVQDGFLDLSDVSKIQISRFDLQRFAVLPGDVLMNEGGDLDKLGRGAIWEGAFEPCVHQNHVFIVRCGPDICPTYLNTWSSSNAARRYFAVAGKQTTNLASISKTALSQLPVAVPPPHEQRAIAEALSDVNSLLVGLDRLIAKKRDLKQAAMQQLLTGKTRLPDFRGEWVASTIGAEFEVALGKMLDAVKNQGLPQPYIGNKAVQWGHIDIGELQKMPMSADELQRYRLVKGDLLVCEGGEVGRAAIWDASIDECYYQKALHRLRPLRGFNPRLLAALLQLWVAQGALSNYVTQTSIAHLPREKFMQVPLPVPSAAEQAAIVQTLADMDEELAALKARRDKTRALRQAMMQELLTGRIRLV